MHDDNPYDSRNVSTVKFPLDKKSCPECGNEMHNGYVYSATSIHWYEKIPKFFSFKFTSDFVINSRSNSGYLQSYQCIFYEVFIIVKRQ